MNNKSVKDFMVPIDEYATVRVGTTLLDAILVLEKVQEEYHDSIYQHRAILVLDENDNVVGKVGQLRVLKAVETRYDLDHEFEDLQNFGFSEKYINRKREDSRLKGPILTDEALQSAAGKRVEEFMQKPTQGEFVSEDCSLDVAIHRLISGTHLSLLVTRKDKIIGILKMADVFGAVFHKMRDVGMK